LKLLGITATLWSIQEASCSLIKKEVASGIVVDARSSRPFPRGYWRSRAAAMKLYKGLLESCLGIIDLIWRMQAAGSTNNDQTISARQKLSGRVPKEHLGGQLTTPGPSAGTARCEMFAGK
jgi:hypothetical protein